MKLTTLNLYGFFGWNERETHILTYLQKIQSDILFFQEVVFLPSESMYSQPAILNETLGYEYVHISIPRLQASEHYPEYREGLAVLSKFPIINTEVLSFKSQPADPHQRLVQFIDAKIDGKIVKFANLHLSLADEFLRLQLEELFEILNARGEKRIIAGDFNSSHLEAHADIWGDEYTLSTDTPYISYPSEDKRIDYFLVPSEYSIGDVEVSGDGLSDHRAVTVAVTDNS
jgi:endonuclease/exonuclease/phosphatase family metal-dependent hydrolase